MPLAAIVKSSADRCTGVVACFAMFTVRGLRVARSRERPLALLAAGLASLIGMQAWIIMAGNANLAPLTGVTLPFVSYGGSSLLMSFLCLVYCCRSRQIEIESPCELKGTLRVHICRSLATLRVETRPTA